MKHNTPLSQTSVILYREPTYTEKYGKSANIFSNICGFLLLFIIFLGLGFIAISKSEQNAARQVESMVKIASNDGDE